MADWKLLKGSHPVPGAAGETNIIEAALVAASRPYREVEKLGRCRPHYVSEPLFHYVLNLNDEIPDALRQELLMPFVHRLVASADGEKIE